MAIFSRLEQYKSTGLLVMRIGLGVMMIIHGLPKINSGPDGWTKLGMSMGYAGIHFAPMFWGFMCAVTETIGGLFCILGLWFRLVCVLLIINFIVASLEHLGSGGTVVEASHAIELAFVFFGLMFTGPGKFSVDKG